RGVSERRVDEPPLPIARPDRPAVPGPGIAGLPVPLEVADVAGLEVLRLPVPRAQDRDARVGAVVGPDLVPGLGLGGGRRPEERGHHAAGDKAPARPQARPPPPSGSWGGPGGRSPTQIRRAPPTSAREEAPGEPVQAAEPSLLVLRADGGVGDALVD